MSHDRMTLAGTMFSQGIFYIALSLWGIKQGLHWAKRTIQVSALLGFMSFFSFLGFGYLDPLHVFVATILFQMTVQVVVREDSPLSVPPIPIMFESGSWKRSLFISMLRGVRNMIRSWKRLQNCTSSGLLHPMVIDLRTDNFIKIMFFRVFG